MSGHARASGDLRRLAAFIGALAIAGALANVTLAWTTFRIVTPAELSVQVLSISPDPVALGQFAVLAARTTGPRSTIAIFGYHAEFAFGGTIRGGGTMARVNATDFQAEVGPFFNATEVWVAITASTPSRPPILPAHRVFTVGQVARNLSALSVLQAGHLPQEPSRFEGFTVFADVSSLAIVEVSLQILVFGSSCFTQDARPMVLSASSRYVASSTILCEGGSFGDVVVAYRVTARDAMGNTAASDPQAFIAMGPRAVP